MNIAQIEANVQKILKSFDPGSFIYDLLLAYGQPKASIKRLQHGGLNLSTGKGEILWKKKLFFKSVNKQDLHEVIDTIRSDHKMLRHDPRFIVVTDFTAILAIDRKTLGTLDVNLNDLPKHFDFFLPWAGMEKAQLQNENPADVKAAERMAKLYDEIKKDNPAKTLEEVHNLNVFLSRLLFCFFAEDTGIFEPVQFTNAISGHSQSDGSDLHGYVDKLFDVLNTEQSKRKSLPAYLDAFPYVNGGLFKNKHYSPAFTRRSRQALIDGGQLEWKDINPDIFGSMIQAVVTPEHRGGLGMHYTSVPNIMKVIEPLFLNELYEQLEFGKGNKKALAQLLTRIWHIKIFDPACGSGNFLIIAYKELRRLEMKIFRTLNTLAFSNISLGNFYGIEIDDFAHEVATLSLWLAEHQMNQEFFKEFGRTKPALPLKDTGNIIQGNATRVNWEEVCPKNEGDETFILGNPPYLGARVQNKTQKTDLDYAFKNSSKYKDLDYIACWFYLGSKYIKASNSRLAFVSTNSICQGEQVSILWPMLFSNDIKISFAHTSFKWSNNAKSNAGVIVVIVGLENSSRKSIKRLYAEKLNRVVENINPYLAAGRNIYVERRNVPLSDFPKMSFGNMANDGGGLILETIEKEKIVREFPRSSRYFKKLLGSLEFIRGEERWCLWIDDKDLKDVLSIPPLRERIKITKNHRLSSKDKGTIKLAMRPHQFRDLNRAKSTALIIPRVSSERRDYIPIGFLDSDTIISDSAQAIYDPEPYVFAILNSRLHMTWVRAVAGRLKSDYRYSNSICYNAFPFPPINSGQKQELQKYAYQILERREDHSEKTLAQLYDPGKMPPDLKEVHHQLNQAVERCYRSKPFETDEERLEYLFKLYEQMTLEEQTKGTLFEVEKKLKKKKK
ncbi:MAG: DNA methyltransferase [Chryseolinea sp.]